MSDVSIEFGDNPSETATLLLAAAVSLGRDQSEVRVSLGDFIVDEQIANEAGFGEPAGERPAKKAPSKKAAAKKAAAKKTQE